MSKKEKFIEEVEEIINSYTSTFGHSPLSEDSMTYWEVFKGKAEIEKPLFTDNGKLIIKYMQEHISDMPMAKAREIGEGLFISSRAVSGAIRKLVSDGYVEKIGQDPTIYSLTNKGKEVVI